MTSCHNVDDSVKKKAKNKKELYKPFLLISKGNPNGIIASAIVIEWNCVTSCEEQ